MILRNDPFREYAIVRGGLHGRPSGNVSGIVYGGARTRTGKVVTARELVFPSNPKTAAQLLQRLIFKQSLYASRHLAAEVWQEFFNRAIGQLPGFQSMMSIILDNTNAAEEFEPPPDTPLGNLHFPDTLTVTSGAGAAGTITITYTDELGLNGTVDDRLRLIAVSKDPVDTDERLTDKALGTTDREDSPYVNATGPASTEFVVGIWFEGYGTAEGLLSPCKWYAVTTHA